MVQTAQRRRRDSLPENTQYKDNGCNLHHSCLTCPFELCQYDMPGGSKRLRDDALVRAADRQGVPAEELAAMFGLSRRSVFRVLQKRRAR